MAPDSAGIRSAVVVIPVYNEAENVAPLVAELRRSLQSVEGWAVTLLFVDGASPDGTADRIRDLMRAHEDVRLLAEPERAGIGAAYKAGFRRAIDELDADVVIEFDGDLQHPAACVPALLAGIDDGADVVLGSRRRRGGTYPERWGFGRLFLSRVGGFVARALLFFPRPCFLTITDPTSGLRATRVHPTMVQIDTATLSDGFGYKVELLHRLSRVTDRIVEIPLRFRPRTHGEPKMNAYTPREVLVAALSARWRDPSTQRFLRYLLIGATAYLVTSLGLELYRRSGLFAGIAASTAALGNESSLAAAAAVETSIVYSFLLNNFWTWRERRARRLGVFLLRLLKFNLLEIGAIFIQFAAVGVITSILGDTVLVRQLALAASVGLLVVPYNWFMHNRVIWRGEKPRQSEQPS